MRQGPPRSQGSKRRKLLEGPQGRGFEGVIWGEGWSSRTSFCLAGVRGQVAAPGTLGINLLGSRACGQRWSRSEACLSLSRRFPEEELGPCAEPSLLSLLDCLSFVPVPSLTSLISHRMNPLSGTQGGPRSPKPFSTNKKQDKQDPRGFCTQEGPSGSGLVSGPAFP